MKVIDLFNGFKGLYEEDIKINKKINNIPYKNVVDFGVINDCNYYNPVDKKYYKDSSFTQLATDNTEKLQEAINSGYNLVFTQGKFYSDPVILNKPISIIGYGATIYTESSQTLKSLFNIRSSNVSIEGIKGVSTLDYSPLIADTPQEGKGSNVFFFKHDSGDNIYIKNCITEGCCRGYDKSTSTKCKNVYIDNCNFLEATIPFYCQNVSEININNTTLECNDTGLAPSLHSVYINKNSEDITFNNCKLKFPTFMESGIIQLRATSEIDYVIKNINFKNCEIETNTLYQIVGRYSDVVNFKGCKFISNQIDNTKAYSVLALNELVREFNFEGCDFIYDKMASFGYCSVSINPNAVKLTNCNISMDSNGVLFYQNPYELLNVNIKIDTADMNNAIIKPTTNGAIKMSSCNIEAIHGKMLFISDLTSGTRSEFYSNTILNRETGVGQAVYNKAEGTYTEETKVIALNNKFYGYTKVFADTIPTNLIVLDEDNKASTSILGV